MMCRPPLGGGGASPAPLHPLAGGGGGGGGAGALRPPLGPGGTVSAAASAAGPATSSSKNPLGVDHPPMHAVFFPPEHVNVLLDTAAAAAAGGTPGRSAAPAAPAAAAPAPGSAAAASRAVTLHGEVLVFRDVECYFRSPAGARIVGALSATTYQVTFSHGGPMPLSMRHLHPSFFTAPVGFVRRIDKSTPRGREAGSAFFVDVSFKDCRAWSLGFRDEATADKVASHLRVVAFPAKLEYLHCFAEAAGGGAGAAAGWDIYNPYRELERLGVLAARHPRTGEALWRVSDANREYAFCPTYPSVLVFPERMSDAAMVAVGGFRSKARVPALTWMHPVNKTTLWRCSQPHVGMTNNTCREDELLLNLIRDANLFVRAPAAPLLVADCRPRANAMANKVNGWGYESYAFAQLEFLGIHNIHAVRDCYKKMEALALSAATSDINWTAQLSDAGWLYNVRTVLSGALFVAECMHRRGQSVVVHCSDGWDRTAQVCGLVQLLLDPYYRTLRGFASLVTKEWASFGFKFSQRNGHASSNADDTDISPIFVQWLDAVYQLVRQFPVAFEFNARALLLLAHHAYSCRFGDFLFNCERERMEARLPARTFSLWGYMLSPARVPALLNPGYDPTRGDVLLPHPSACLRSVEVWADWWLRWSPFPSLLPSVSRLERYAPGGYDHARVLDAMVRAPGSDEAAAGGSGGGGSGGSGGGSSDRGEGSVAALSPLPEPARPAVDPLTGVPLAAVPVVMPVRRTSSAPAVDGSAAAAAAAAAAAGGGDGGGGTGLGASDADDGRPPVVQFDDDDSTGCSGPSRLPEGLTRSASPAPARAPSPAAHIVPAPAPAPAPAPSPMPRASNADILASAFTESAEDAEAAEALAAAAGVEDGTLVSAASFLPKDEKGDDEDTDTES